MRKYKFKKQLITGNKLTKHTLQYTQKDNIIQLNQLTANGDKKDILNHLAPNELTYVSSTILGVSTTVLKLNYRQNIFSTMLLETVPTTISKYTFSNPSTILELILPEGVRSMSDDAFMSNKVLKSISLPNSLKSIGFKTFMDCPSLSKINIPKNVTSIGSSAFYKCYFTKDNFINNSALDAEANNYWSATIVDKEINGLLIQGNKVIKGRPYIISAVIPENITSIGWGAFLNCTSLTSITIPNSVTSIVDYTFDGCSSLSSIVIPDSVTSLKMYAFRGCSSLESITIPDSVASIESYAFGDCTALKYVNYIGNIGNWCMTDGLYYTNANPFSFSKQFYLNGELLTDLVTPENVTIIESAVFQNVQSLKSVVISEGVTYIGNYAFKGCASIVSVSLPSSLTTIRDEVFYNCKSLASITYNGTVELWNAITKGRNIGSFCASRRVQCLDGIGGDF